MKEKLKGLWEKAKEIAKKAWLKAEEIANKVVTFMKQNPIVTVALIGLIKTVMNNGSRLVTSYRDDDRRKRGFFDHRRGRWSYSKKTPTRYQLEEIEWRYQNGESYRAILDDMGLLRGK